MVALDGLCIGECHGLGEERCAAGIVADNDKPLHRTDRHRHAECEASPGGGDFHTRVSVVHHGEVHFTAVLDIVVALNLAHASSGDIRSLLCPAGGNGDVVQDDGAEWDHRHR